MNIHATALGAASRLTCEHCYGTGYGDLAEGKAVYRTAKSASHACYLCTGLEVIDFKEDGMPGTWRKLGFAIIQSIKQQAGLELVSNFRIAEAVDESLDSHFIRGKSDCWHDGRPRRQPGLGSLAVLAGDSSSFRHQDQSEVVSNHLKISFLSHRQPLLNILHREEDCSAFRKFVRVLDRNFARAANPFTAAANHIASAPATITDWNGKRRNCVVTERYDLQHFGLLSLGIGKEFLLLVINQHGKAVVRLHQSWCNWEMSGEQG